MIHIYFLFFYDIITEKKNLSHKSIKSVIYINV